MTKEKNDRSLIWIIVITLCMAGAYWLYAQYRQTKQCNQAGTRDAVLMYPADRYPDTEERTRLQSDYERKAIVECGS